MKFGGELVQISQDIRLAGHFLEASVCFNPSLYTRASGKFQGSLISHLGAVTPRWPNQFASCRASQPALHQQKSLLFHAAKEPISDVCYRDRLTDS